MAPSTIPGAGLGIFTAVPRKPGDVLNGNAAGDVLIPVIDVQYHLTHNRNPKDTVQFTLDYVWNGADLGMARESAHGEHTASFPEGVTAFAPGLDAAINCHLALINVEKGTPDHNPLGLHRSRDPGAGAFSPYHNCTTLAASAIPAGGELYVRCDAACGLLVVRFALQGWWIACHFGWMDGWMDGRLRCVAGRADGTLIFSHIVVVFRIQFQVLWRAMVLDPRAVVPTRPAHR